MQKPMQKTRAHKHTFNKRRKTQKMRKPAIKSCRTKDSTVKTAIIVENFIEMLNNIKLYHWNTHSFSQHKATDELHAQMSEHIDKFVEVLLGKKESRIRHLNSTSHLINNKNTKSFKDRIYQYREYLISMNKCFDKNTDSDLLNIRDEILGDINQFLYLLTLDK